MGGSVEELWTWVSQQTRGMGMNLHAWGRIGQVSTAGVWSRLEQLDRCGAGAMKGGQVSTPGVGVGPGLPKLGPRPGGSFNRSGSMGEPRASAAEGIPDCPSRVCRF